MQSVLDLRLLQFIIDNTAFVILILSVDMQSIIKHRKTKTKQFLTT